MPTGRFSCARRQLYRIQYAEVEEVKAMPARCIHHKAHPGAVRRAVRLKCGRTGVEINILQKSVVSVVWTTKSSYGCYAGFRPRARGACVKLYKQTTPALTNVAVAGCAGVV